MEIIAEIGQNHNGDMQLACDLIKAAKDNGADVAKFQLYNAKKVFPKEGNEWFEYNCQTEISKDQMYLLAEECKKVDIEFMASAFDTERVNWLEELGVQRYKIASRSIFDKELIQKISDTGKSMLVSLAFWDKPEFPKIQSKGKVQYLYCISEYPTMLNDLKFSQIEFPKKYIGFSDHTVGITAAIVAFARGAQILEKHFTLDKSMYGPDHLGSMTPGELKQIHKYRLEIEQCL